MGRRKRGEWKGRRNGLKTDGENETRKEKLGEAVGDTFPQLLVQREITRKDPKFMKATRVVLGHQLLKFYPKLHNITPSFLGSTT